MTTKIKPRKGWSRYSKPYLPSAPEPPLKTLQEVNETTLSRKTLYDEERFTLDELIPAGHDPSTLGFTFKCNRSRYDGDCDYEIVTSTVTTTERENPQYKRQLKAYEKTYGEWKAKKDAFTEELKEWKAWVKQEDEADTKRQLAWAEKLLKKHGKI